MELSGLREPVVAAPMAGGPSTPELAAAVSEAGGLGFLAAGYLTVDAVREQIRETRTRTARPVGVNMFVPGTDPVDERAVREYTERLRPEVERLGVEPGVPTGGDDGWAGKLALLVEERISIASFAFGLPKANEIAALHEAGTAVLVTVTTPEEAVRAEEAGADGLIAQGIDAGAHRGGFADDDGTGEYGVLALLALVGRVSRLPVVAAGGIADGAGIAAVLAAGAVAAQLGTAFLRCPEAGTSAVHRAALDRPAETVLTRAFTGRRARAIANRFTAEHSAAAPSAYPHVHQVTAPLRAAARAAGDAGSVNLWAGRCHPLAEEMPAGELVRRLGAEARSALRVSSARFDR